MYRHVVKIVINWNYDYEENSIVRPRRRDVERSIITLATGNVYVATLNLRWRMLRVKGHGKNAFDDVKRGFKLSVISLICGVQDRQDCHT